MVVPRRAPPQEEGRCGRAAAIVLCVLIFASLEGALFHHSDTIETSLRQSSKKVHSWWRSGGIATPLRAKLGGGKAATPAADGGGDGTGDEGDPLKYTSDTDGAAEVAEAAAAAAAAVNAPAAAKAAAAAREAALPPKHAKDPCPEGYELVWGVDHADGECQQEPLNDGEHRMGRVQRVTIGDCASMCTASGPACAAFDWQNGNCYRNKRCDSQEVGDGNSACKRRGVDIKKLSETAAAARARSAAWFAARMEEREAKYANGVDAWWGVPYKKLGCCTERGHRCVWERRSPFTIPPCERDNLILLLRWLQEVVKVPTMYLNWGTLLGAIREGTHIKYETDIDVAVERRSWEDAKPMINLLLEGTHFHIGHYTSHSKLYYRGWYGDIHVDIWYMDRFATTSDESDDGAMDTFNNDVLYPLRPCTYGNHSFACPRDSETWLAMSYGPDWRTPYSRTPATKTRYHATRHGRVKRANLPCKYPPTDQRAHDPAAWAAFGAAVRALDAAKAPYRLHGGSLLAFAKDCDVNSWDTQVDFALPLAWLGKATHRAALTAALGAAGFARASERRGAPGKEGYRETWAFAGKDSALLGGGTPDAEHGGKPDGTAAAADPKEGGGGQGGRVIHLYTTVPPTDADGGPKPDVSGPAGSGGDVSFLWDAHGATVGRCRDVYKGIATYDWGGVAVRVPVPFDALLVAQYGHDFASSSNRHGLSRPSMKKIKRERQPCKTQT